MGFKVLRVMDHSRAYAGGADRPVPIAVWYPARADSAARLRYAAYVDLYLDEELSSSVTGEARDQNRDEWAQMFTRRSAGAIDGRTILEAQVEAVRDAPWAAGSFPLVVYGPGADGEVFENSVLFEVLASHGYVVAASPSIGTFRHAMDAQHPAGLETQARDLEFVLGKMRAETGVDWSRTVLAGWSWGGLAALLVQMRDARIDAVISLDGSVALHSDKAEGSPWFSLPRMRVPYLFVTNSASVAQVNRFLDRSRYSSAWHVEMAALTHGDFASYGYLARRAVAEPDPEAAARRDGYAYMAALVLAFLDNTVGDGAAGLPEILGTGQSAGVVTSWAHRQPLPAPPLEEEFIDIVTQKGVDAAQDAFGRAREADPDYVMFREYELTEVAFDLNAQGRSDDAVRLMALAVEQDPSSWTAHGYLARLYEHGGRLRESLAHFGQAHGLAVGRLESDARASGDIDWYRRSIDRLLEKLARPHTQ